jgi:uncharacterized protein (TIRG00374 family)
MKKNRWQLWLGIVVSVTALALALLGIDPRQVAENLAGARYGYLIPAAVALLAYDVARSFRWRLLLGPEVSLARCFWITNVGYLVSNILPLRLGDPARAVAIGLEGKVKVSAALSTVAVERVLDMLMVVLLLLISLPFVAQAGLLQSVGVLAGLVALIVLAAMVLVALRPEWVRRFARWILSHIPRLNADRWLGMLDGLLDGLAALRSPRRFAETLVWSVVTWVFVVGFYWGMLWVFRDWPPLVQGSFLTCGIGLGMALPSAPGAVGVFHSAAEYALHLPFGISKGEAFTIAFVSHAFQYVFSCILGLIGLAQLGLSLGQLRADAATAAEAAATVAAVPTIETMAEESK